MTCLRPAVPEDARAIAEIWNRMIEDTASTFTTERTNPTVLANRIARDGAARRAWHVAARDTEVLGFAMTGPFRKGPGYALTEELTLILDPSACGSGIGPQLLAAIETNARRRGIHSLIAGTSGENMGATRFFKREGYVKVAEIPEVGYKFSRWLDLILLQKRL